MNLVGKIIGNRYEILKEIGNGGMAIVYKAKDHVLNRDVAVKVLRDEYTTDSDFIKRFNIEAQSAANLQHPNIVAIYDVGHEEENNLYYIVMELIKGKTLKEIINKDEKLSWKWAINIAIQIASALENAHKNGIVHRDIKPHNIMITEDGVAKVTDFGIAKAVSNSTITSFGTTIGSVHYFSPEQAKGSVTDAKSDLYSLGVVMYEMLTGKVPFDADTPVSVALKHIQEEPVPPIELNPEIPTAVNDIVLKAMKKDPTERYQSATEMLADLSKALKDPDGDFVIVENKDGAYTRIMNAVGDNTNTPKKSKRKKFFEEHPRTKVMVAILSLVLLFIVVFLITKVALEGGFKSKVNIPDLTNKTQDEAQRMVDDLGLKLEEEDPQASSTVEAGKVISQDPKFENNKKIAKGSTIKIILSKGPETAEMPKFVGENIETVKEKADEMGLLLDISETYSNDVDEGKVISQDVKSGRQVKSGDTIKIVVSKGAEKTTVPTVVDMDEGTAKATLSNAKLKANVTYSNDSTKADGKVIFQSIEQGKQVNINTTIDIVVNKIEVKESKVKIQLKVSVAGTALAKTDSENSNSVEQQVTKLTVPVVVSTDNGNQKLTKNITIDLTKANSNDNIFDLGEISGNDSKTIVIKGNISGKDVVMGSETINIDEYNGGRKIFGYTLNSL